MSKRDAIQAQKMLMAAGWSCVEIWADYDAVNKQKPNYVVDAKNSNYNEGLKLSVEYQRRFGSLESVRESLAATV
jgi:hypothetical protein